MNSVAIIGGGITGLTAAFRLKERGIPVTLYESGDRVGGVIQTVKRDGFMAECGPNSLLETSPLIKDLVRDVGLEGKRLYSDPAAEKRFLVRGGRTVDMPGGPGSFLATPLFSTKAKLRLALEPFIRRGSLEKEESLADFVLRRIGREFLDYAINPFVAGVYAGDPAKLSVKHAFPKLLAIEQRYGSLILGQFLGARERKRSKEVSKQSAPKLSFTDGLQTLTDGLGAHLRDSLQLQSPVQAIKRTAEGWRLTTGGAMTTEHDHSAVLLAAPSHRLATIKLEAPDAPSLSRLAEIPYAPVTSLVFGFRRDDVAHPLDGFGMLIPEVERFSILGAIFSSSLFPGRAPAGHVTISCYIGGTRAPELAVTSFERQRELALADLRKILGVEGRPVFSHHFTFRKAIPQYEVGFGKYRDFMSDVENRAPGLFLGGHYRDGISLGDSIVSGHNNAERIAAFVAAQSLTNKLHNQINRAQGAVAAATLDGIINS
jgi:protoporphyrinogen/coproporphyrinogen III oxidase